ncbi:type IV secretion system protein [Rickettsia endosymbiont of Halotydeus destructor]|uniref:type IV secretion system protein n=1 Tax=Rickettsia endosymbiont of Halotydeus destructor TaxID=2996754 RepID=UPI003BAE744C
MKIFLRTIIKILILSCTLNFSINAHAKDTIDTITDTLTSLTCETQGIGDLLRSEFSHTCIPAPFFTFAVMNLVSPVLYMNTLLKLKINNHEIFDSAEGKAENIPQFPGGQCTRNNRADSKDPRLTFGLCSNVSLAKVRAQAIADSAIAIASSIFTGKDPWDDIKDSWESKAASYHEIYKDKKPGDSGTLIDFGFPVIFWKVVQENDRICLSTPGFTGYVPVGCKYVKEPFPESMYSSFMDINGTNSATSNPADPLQLVECNSSGSEGCYQRAYNASKTAVVITSPLIECIKEMTARLLISKDVCSFDDVNKVVNSSLRQSSSLFQFQVNMHKIVTALLTLYVIFFGFKIILAGEVPPKAEFINFILKMLFVTYFSIGINITPGSTSNYNRLDGMIQFVFPFLLNGISGLASWVINASPSDLCKFNSSNIQYDSKIAYIALWDALDCRVAHYLGLDMLSTLYVENMYKAHDFKNFDFFSFSAPPYIYLLIPAIISGQMTLVSIALSYPLLVISVAAFMVNSTVMCMISIVILGILAPLFVPMFLFTYTRSYFDQWVKLLISFLLQPMVVTTFMITMFSVYDFGFYGKCKYNNTKISNSIENVMQTGSLTATRDVIIFYINNNWEEYANQDDVKSCKNSLGYMLNNPLSTMFDFDKKIVSEIVKEKPGATDTDKYLAKFEFLSGVVLGPGMFFISPKVIFEKIKDIVLALITACFTLYLMYNFSSQLAEFAADMTEGVSLRNVAIKPQAIFKAGMAAVAAAGQATKGLDQIAKGGGGVGRDAAAGKGGAGGSSDLNSGSGGGSENSSSDLSIGSGGTGGTTPTSGGSNSNRGSTPGATRAFSPTQETSGNNNSDVPASIRASISEPASLKSPDITISQPSSDSKKEEDKLPESPKASERIKRTEEADKFEDLSGQLNIERRTESITDDKQDNISTEKKSYGLAQEKSTIEQESHEKKMGETGYIAQEKRNAEIRDNQARTEKAQDELLKSGGGRAGPNSKKIDSGSNENS